MDVENGVGVDDCGRRNVSSMATTEAEPVRTGGSEHTMRAITLAPSISPSDASFVRSRNPPPLRLQHIFDSGRMGDATVVRCRPDLWDHAILTLADS